MGEKKNRVCLVNQGGASRGGTNGKAIFASPGGEASNKKRSARGKGPTGDPELGSRGGVRKEVHRNLGSLRRDERVGPT